MKDCSITRCTCILGRPIKGFLNDILAKPAEERTKFVVLRCTDGVVPIRDGEKHGSSDEGMEDATRQPGEVDHPGIVRWV